MEDLTVKTMIWLQELGMDVKFELFDVQKRALKIIMDDKGLLLVIPTGMGKTIIGAAASAFSAKIKNKKSLLLAPLRSLTSEHVSTYHKYGLRTILDNGEHRKDLGDYGSTDYDVIISTFEKMDAIIRNYDDKFDDRGLPQKRDVIFGDIDSIIIDEIHGIEDEERGVNLESFIMSVKHLYPHIKIIGLSATIGNYVEFARWLGVPYVYEPKESRPVPLEIVYRELYQSGYENQALEKMVYLKSEYELTRGEKRMIAVTAISRTVGIAKALCGIEGREDPPLGMMMDKHRIGWHYSKMPEADRLAVEWAFQYEDLPNEEEFWYEYNSEYICRKDWLLFTYGLMHGIDTIVCTPTLIVGRNLPVTHITIFDHRQFSFTRGSEIIGPNRMQQTIGRAGRQKFAYNPDGTKKEGYKGVATIYVPVVDYNTVMDNAELAFDIKSRLINRIGEKMLAWINSRIVRNKTDLTKFISTSLDHRFLDPKLIKRKLNFLSKFQFIEELDDGTLYVTEKGRLTIKYYVQPESVVKWGKIVRDLINSKSKVKLNQLMMRSMDVEEYISSVSVMDRELSILGLMRRKVDLEGVSNQAVKAFVFCFPLYSFKLMEIDEKDYTVPKDESTSIRLSFMRLISAFSEIYNKTSVSDALQIARYMVESGVFHPKLGELMSIKGIGVKYAERLLKAGIDSKTKFYKMAAMNRKKILFVTNLTARKLNKILEDNRNTS